MVAGSQSITNEIDNIVNIIDETAAGTQSATRNLDSLQDKAEAAAQAIDGAADALEGVAMRSATSTSTLSKGVDASVMSFLRMGQSVDVASQKMLQLQRAQDRLAQVQAQASTAVANGMGQDDADAIVAGYKARVDGLQQEVTAARSARSALNDLTDAHGRSTSAAKLTGYQLGIVADEAHKFADQILAGGSALTAAFYQLPNMIQTVGGLGNATKIAAGFLSGPGGIALAAGAAGVALSKMGAYAEGEQEHLAQLGQHLRATRDDALSMAGAVTSASDILRKTPGWNTADARSVASTIGSTYNFTGSSSDVVDLAGIARDAGTVFGSLEDGLKAVQQAMVDPTAEIESLYKQHLPGVDAALVSQIKTLQASGQQGAAYALVIGRIHDATKGATDQALTPFQRSLQNLHSVLDPLTDGIGRLSVSLGTTFLNTLTSVLSVLPQRAQVAANGLNGSQVLDNYAGGHHHYGLGQVDPRYAGGYDIMTPRGNIDAAISIFQEANKRAEGNWDKTLAYYSGNPVGGSGQQSYNRAVYGYDIYSLPTDTSDLIEQESSRLGLSSRLVKLFKGVIGHESGGHQYRNADTKEPDTATSLKHATSAAVISDQASLAAGAPVDAGGYSASSYTAQRQEIEAYITAEQKLQTTQVAGSEAWKETSEKITSARVALAETLSPQEKITQGLTDSLAPLKAQSGYWRSMAEVVAQFDQTTRGTGVDQQALSEALSSRQRALAQSYQDGTEAAERQARSQDAVANAAGGSALALQHAANYQQAYTEALQDFNPQSAEFTAAVRARTDALDQAASAQMRAQQLQQNSSLSDNLQMIQAENATLGQNAEERQKSLSVMQAELEMHRKYGTVLPQEAQAYVALQGSVAQASSAYEHHQQVLQDVTGSLSNMTDQLTDGITQGFLQGTSSGLSFRNILQGIETQVVSMIAKMALINPLLNKIDGGSRTTLADMENLFSGTSLSSGSLEELQQFSSAAGSNRSATGQLGQAIATSGWAPSELQVLYGGASTSGQSGSTGGLFSGVGSASLSGMSLVSGKASSPFGSLSDMVRGQGGLLSSRGVSALGTLGGATSFGMGILGGIGMGSSVGSMTSSLTGGGASGMLGATIGSGVGAIGGGILGGPLGSMIGGTIVGAVGGLLGGLFSPKHYVYDSVIGADGRLGIGSTRSHKASDDVREGLQSSLDTLNAVYSDAGITVGDGGYGEVGHYQKGSSKSSKTLQDLLPGVRLSSDNATENLALQQIMPSSFDSVESYTQTIESIRQLADTLDALHVSVSKFDDATHVTVGHISGYTGELGQVLAGFDGKRISTSALQSEISTLKSLLDLTDSGAQSLVSQVADLRDKYQQAADQAQRYGLDYQVILDKGSAIAQSMLDAETTKLAQSDQSVQARLLAARGDQEGSDLITFDVSAAQQRKALDDEWLGYLGDSYADNQDYATQMADLDRTLAAERLKIQQTYAGTSLAQQEQYLSQAQQSVAGVFTSLASYVQGLNTSDVSPLSAQQQYDVANENFQTDYRSAMGGDYDALSRVQGDAQTLLPLAQSYLGSGQDYAQLYQKTLEKLQSLGGVNTDTVTAALMQKLAQAQVTATGQTTQAVEKLGSSLTTELRQLNMLLTTRA